LPGLVPQQTLSQWYKRIISYRTIIKTKDITITFLGMYVELKYFKKKSMQVCIQDVISM